jgi:large subunit ribosomal protein L18
MGKKTRSEMRKRRHRRVRVKISGTADRPRLNVFRSINQIYAQLIDDSQGHSIASASSLDPELKSDVKGVDKARQVGELLGKRAKKSGVKQVVFDRGGYRYHGKVKALAEAAREAGLEF